MEIRPVRAADAERVLEIFRAVVAGRDTYVFAPDTPRDDVLAYWFGPGVITWVAESDGIVSGMYKLIANHRDLGSHVANASFMVDPRAAGQGIGRALAEHCLREARWHGYDAMQFNFVVSTNPAVALWQRLGFAVVGTLPRVFRHGTRGLVDAYVMYRSLDDIVLTFGVAPADAAVATRHSAYAVVANDRGELAVVDGADGRLLPGGGVDAGESPADAASRETREECAVHIVGLQDLGRAIEVLPTDRLGGWVAKDSRFFAAHCARRVAEPPEHRTEWFGPEAALDALTYGSHRWAVRRWLRHHR